MVDVILYAALFYVVDIYWLIKLVQLIRGEELDQYGYSTLGIFVHF